MLRPSLTIAGISIVFLNNKTVCWDCMKSKTITVYSVAIIIGLVVFFIMLDRSNTDIEADEQEIATAIKADGGDAQASARRQNLQKKDRTGDGERVAKDLPAPEMPDFDDSVSAGDLGLEKGALPTANADNEHYISLPDSELESAAERGDKVAQEEWGTRLVYAKDRADEGIEWLVEAASYGSHSAILRLAQIYLMGAGSKEQDVIAYLAWSRVSYMLGNWRSLTLTYGYSSNLSLEEMLLVDVLAAVYYNEINDRHYQRTGRYLEFELVPGAEETLNSILESD